MELEKYKNILQEKKSFVQVALVQKNGLPHVSPLWFDINDEDLTNGFININTATGRVKSRDLNVGSKVALSIMDPDNAYRYLGIQGTVNESIKGQVAEEHIDTLTKKYMNQDQYPFRNPNEQRIKLRIKIDKIYGN